MNRGMIISIDTVTQVSIKFRKKKQANKKMGISIEHDTNNTYKLAICVYEYGRGGKCVYMFRYTYAGIRIINMQVDKEDKHMSRVMRITRTLCHRYVLNLERKKI